MGKAVHYFRLLCTALAHACETDEFPVHEMTAVLLPPSFTKTFRDENQCIIFRYYKRGKLLHQYGRQIRETVYTAPKEKQSRKGTNAVQNA